MADKNIVEAKWVDNMAFEGEVNGHKIIIDADDKVGGHDRGPRPKPLMLLALAGCTGMDVVSILKKMRVEYSDFNVRVEGELNDEHPVHYTHMHIVYEITGKDIPHDKVEKAVSLSQDRYCGVSFSYNKVLELTNEIVYIED